MALLPLGTTTCNPIYNVVHIKYNSTSTFFHLVSSIPSLSCHPRNSSNLCKFDKRSKPLFSANSSLFGESLSFCGLKPMDSHENHKHANPIANNSSHCLSQVFSRTCLYLELPRQFKNSRGSRKDGL